MSEGSGGVGSVGQGGGLRSIPLDDPLYAAPAQVTAVPLDPKLERLPFLEMLPADFERLLARMLVEVEGLRDVRLFGTHGQKDDGLDVVGRAADGTWHGWQGKRYRTYGPADLQTAVEDHTVRGSGEFPVEELVVCVPCDITRQVTVKLRDLNGFYPNLNIVLLGPDELGDRLRNRPDIVTQFFGQQTAERFCLPVPAPLVIAAPGLDRADLADAARRSPAEALGVDDLLADAARFAQANDHRAAVGKLAEAEVLLARSGFDGHAASVARRRADALINAGDLDEAASLLSDAFWQRADAGDTDGVRSISHRLGEALRSVAAEHPGADTPGHGTALQLFTVMDCAQNLLAHPFPEPKLPAPLQQAPDGLETSLARLAVLAGETSALVDRETVWITEHAERLMQLADAVTDTDDLLAVRLRLTVADATGQWTDLVDAAYRRRHRRILCALILARYARHLAITEGSPGAAEFWKEAVEQACLDGHNADAGEWVHAQRLLHQRTVAMTLPAIDDLDLAKALLARPGRSKLLGAGDLLTKGIGALHDKNLRTAALALRQQVRLSAASGRWFDEHIARRRLAEALLEAGEYDRAADHAVTVGETKIAKNVAKAAAEHFADVTHRLGSEPYWEKATVFRLLGEQADLLPDALVNEVADAALVVATAEDVSATRFPAGNPSPHLAAHDLLAALAGRLDLPRAAQLLSALEPLAPRPKGTYHLTDHAQAAFLAEVATTHPDLRDKALDQILAMLAGNLGDTKALRRASELLHQYGHGRIEQLSVLAADGSWVAAEALAYLTDATSEGHPPSDQKIAQARQALARLTAPRAHTPGRIDLGIGEAVGRDAAQIRVLPEPDRIMAIRALIDRGRGPEAALDRADCIDAAASIATSLTQGAASDGLCETALEAADHDSGPNAADLAMGGMNHQLSGFRINLASTDIRAHWILLAAVVARSTEHAEQVRERILLALPAPADDGGYRLAQALQFLPREVVAPHTLLLAAHPHWAVRSLSAILWAGHAEAPVQLGSLLARDPDVRVRRTLATEMKKRTDHRSSAVATLLAADPRHSVRRLLHGDTSSYR
ncbi:hypothetical protein [Streptomyces calvus]|uniref:hypothetical protein n=1 Tax=Streptomyces calvus TaxID=67282 RepID=UPI00114FE565|nr:hypothetical protein [Streptomyces calvus]